MSGLFLDVAFWACAASAVLHVLASAGRRRLLGAMGLLALIVGAAAGAAFLGREWADIHRPPLAGRAGLAVAFSFALAVFHLLFLRRGPVVPLLAAAGMGLAVLFAAPAEPPPPLLGSARWMGVHVGLCLLGHAGFAVAFAAALGRLVRAGGTHAVCAAATGTLAATLLVAVGAALLATRSGAAVPPPASSLPGMVAGSAFALAGLLVWPVRWGVSRRVAFEGEDAGMDRAVDRSMLGGVLALGLGILAGALWAHETWGSFWRWDPKEIWAAFTWLLAVFYLHARFARGWSGPRAAWIAVATFGMATFTFLGAGSLRGGMHRFLE